MKHTYLLSTGYYLVDEKGTYKIKYLKESELYYFLPESDSYYSESGQTLKGREWDNLIEANYLREQATMECWFQTGNGSILTLEEVDRKLLVYRQGIVLSPVSPCNQEIYESIDQDIHTFYRQLDDDMEVIEEGESAYPYAHLQDMGLYQTLAEDFGGELKHETFNYWHMIPTLVFDKGTVELHEVEVDQTYLTAKLKPRFLTHILMDIQILTQS